MVNKCDCESGIRLCSHAEKLWREANNIYYSQGYNAWINSQPYKDYQTHMKEISSEQCGGAKVIGNDHYRCTLPAYHGGYCKFAPTN